MNYKDKIIALLNSQELSKEQKEKLERIFPELAESEDERIRKALIDYFRWNTDGQLLNEFTNREVFAWLKKQGNNNMGISEATKQELEDNLDKALEKETPESCNEFLEKQGEQKPAWSKEDEKMLDLIIAVFEVNHPNAHFKANELNEPNMEVVYTKEIVAWLKFLKERIQPQPKQEWSEEDEEIYKKVETAIDSYYAPFSRDAEEMSEWFKKLKERYTWKPSDEQMEQLGWIAEQNKDNMIGKELMSLYQDLLKLKG